MGDCFYFNWPQEENAESSLAENAGSSVRFPGQLGLSWPLPVEDRAANASKSHSLAEKRRRDRINAHLATLRKLIPKSDKMDKAALLGSVIDRVKDLKKEATEASDKASTLPTEVDEVAIDFLGDKQQKEGILIRASVCCDDRPEVFGELIRALKGLRLRLVQADIASLGGRIKSILVVCAENGEEGVGLTALKESLSVVLSRIATSSAATSCRFTSKRQRFFFSPH